MTGAGALTLAGTNAFPAAVTLASPRTLNIDSSTALGASGSPFVTIEAKHPDRQYHRRRGDDRERRLFPSRSWAILRFVGSNNLNLGTGAVEA